MNNVQKHFLRQTRKQSTLNRSVVISPSPTISRVDYLFRVKPRNYRIRLGQLPNNHDHIPFIYVSLARTYLHRAQFTEALGNGHIALNIITQQYPSNVLLFAYIYI